MNITIPFVPTWKRRGAQRISHAFRAVELEQYDTVMPLGQCGLFTVADLVVDPNAARCVRCERAVRQFDENLRQAMRNPRLGGPVYRPAPPGRPTTVRSAA